MHIIICIKCVYMYRCIRYTSIMSYRCIHIQMIICMYIYIYTYVYTHVCALYIYIYIYICSPPPRSTFLAKQSLQITRNHETHIIYDTFSYGFQYCFSAAVVNYTSQ